MANRNNINRRQFLNRTAAAAAGAVGLSYEKIY